MTVYPFTAGDPCNRTNGVSPGPNVTCNSALNPTLLNTDPAKNGPLKPHFVPSKTIPPRGFPNSMESVRPWPFTKFPVADSTTQRLPAGTGRKSHKAKFGPSL